MCVCVNVHLEETIITQDILFLGEADIHMGVRLAATLPDKALHEKNWRAQNGVNPKNKQTNKQITSSHNSS